MSAHAEPALIRGLDQALHEGTGGLEGLTEREQQVLVLVSDGYTTKEVAARPGIKFKTTACPPGAGSWPNAPFTTVSLRCASQFGTGYFSCERRIKGQSPPAPRRQRFYGFPISYKLSQLLSSFQVQVVRSILASRSCDRFARRPSGIGKARTAARIRHVCSAPGGTCPARRHTDRSSLAILCVV